MANNYPASLNDHKTDWANDTLVEDVHPEEHNDIAEAVEALEAKVGADSSAVPTSHDFKLNGVADGDKAASLTGEEDLENKTLLEPLIETPAIDDPDIDGGSHDNGTFANPSLSGEVHMDLGSDAPGDIYYRNAEGQLVRLPIGTETQVLTVEDELPEWKTPVGSVGTKVRAYPSSNQSGIGSSPAKLTLDSEVFDVGGDFASSTFTAPQTGYYLVQATAGMSHASASEHHYTILIYKNGSPVARAQKFVTDTNLTWVDVSDLVYLAQGDTIEIYVADTSAAGVVNSGSSNTFVAITNV